MQDKPQLDEELIELEITRMQLFFEKNKYDKELKKWYIDIKRKIAEKSNDVYMLEVCRRMINMI